MPQRLELLRLVQLLLLAICREGFALHLILSLVVLDVSALRLTKLRICLHIELLAISDLLGSFDHILLSHSRLILSNTLQLIN